MAPTLITCTLCFILFVAPFLLAVAFDVREVTGKPNFVAEVVGVNLAILSDEEFQQLNAYLHSYKVLVFRNQSSLTVEEQRQFTSRFGPLHSHLEATSHHPDYNDVNVISNIKNASGIATGLYGEHVESFHTDLSWSHLPTKVTLLKADVLPLEGGDTHYADSTEAYKNLPAEFRERLRGLQGHYSYLKFRDEVLGVTGDEWEYIQRGQDHPLIITHPITGQKNIYANPGHTAHVIGKSAEESSEILSALFAAISDENVLYVHKWRQGDAVLWDNRAMQHRATPSPSSARRMVRTTVLNDDIPREEIQLPTAYTFVKAAAVAALDSIHATEL